jgi:hypothetical protein
MMPMRRRVGMKKKRLLEITLLNSTMLIIPMMARETSM